MAVAAEQGGADSIWVADHLFYKNEGEVRGGGAPRECRDHVRDAAPI
jgi:alkanesulfonate monooxygenase SsuD/methylene tetrahydromethanopterin reductase-like flavin-dependent oxidoreductase (luciferase family)